MRFGRHADRREKIVMVSDEQKKKNVETIEGA
jgi:hypothetical protein